MCAVLRTIRGSARGCVFFHGKLSNTGRARGTDAYRADDSEQEIECARVNVTHRSCASPPTGDYERALNCTEKPHHILMCGDGTGCHDKSLTCGGLTYSRISYTIYAARGAPLTSGEPACAYEDMAMQKRGLAALGLIVINLGLLAPVASGKDLPFAPPRKKETAPIVFSPYEHEALTGTLELGWLPAEQLSMPNKFVIMKFIPKGQDPEWPQKMINFVSYLGAETKGDARDYMLNTQRASEKLAPKGTLSWDVISADNPNDVMFEYSVKNFKDAPDQFEIQRAIKGRDGLHVVIYHMGDAEVPDAERQKMITFLKTSVKIITKEQFIGTADGTKNATVRPPAKQAVSASTAATTK
jgi:hypothetical protein